MLVASRLALIHLLHDLRLMTCSLTGFVICWVVHVGLGGGVGMGGEEVGWVGVAGGWDRWDGVF